MGKTTNSGLGRGTNGSPQNTLDQSNYKNKLSEIARDKMIQPLIDAGVKFTREDVVFVTTDKTGQLVWLEKGNDRAGLQHILKHDKDFQNLHNIGIEQIPEHIQKIITTWDLEYSVHETRGGRNVYSKMFSRNGQYYVVSGIGSNGFIVSTYPTDQRNAERLIKKYRRK